MKYFEETPSPDRRLAFFQDRPSPAVAPPPDPDAGALRAPLPGGLTLADFAGRTIFERAHNALLSRPGGAALSYDDRHTAAVALVQAARAAAPAARPDARHDCAQQRRLTLGGREVSLDQIMRELRTAIAAQLDEGATWEHALARATATFSGQQITVTSGETEEVQAHRDPVGDVVVLAGRKLNSFAGRNVTEQMMSALRELPQYATASHDEVWKQACIKLREARAAAGGSR